MSKSKTGFSKIRFFIQLIFVVLILSISIAHATGWGGENLHGLCPFGGVATLYTFVTTGDYIRHIGQSDFIMLFALILTLVAAGAFFCGWICPLGSVQEWVGKLGRKLFGKRYNKVPKKLDKILGYLRFVVLAIVIIQTARSFTLVFKDYDPYFNLFNIWTDEISITGYITVLVTMIASLLVERPFCRYACPLGAINGLFNAFSITTIRRNETSCIDCKKCDLACPVNLEPSKSKTIQSTACIRCMKCVEACPVNQKEPTLTVSLPVKRQLFKNGMVYAVVMLVLFIVPIGGSIALGAFESEEPPVYESANDVRGSSTIADIVENYNIEADLFYKAFNIPISVDSMTKIKDLEGELGVSVEDIRLYVEYVDKPISEISKGLLPQNTDVSQTLREYVNANVPGSYYHLVAKERVNTTEENKENQIKRVTMLVDIKSMVKDYDDFIKTFSIPQDKPLNTELRDLIDELGIELDAIRTYVETHRK